MYGGAGRRGTAEARSRAQRRAYLGATMVADLAAVTMRLSFRVTEPVRWWAETSTRLQCRSICCLSRPAKPKPQRFVSMTSV